MDSSLLIAAGASFIAGLLGYIIARLWIKPIARYHITKRKLDQELTQYLAQMNETAGPDEKPGKQKHGDAMLERPQACHGPGLLLRCGDSLLVPSLAGQSPGVTH
jgi:hypothetical protein